ncbi:hypothetical protein DENIT_10270 [Pseudomonas veronii]|nr:hypothetical protein DENIT_10270 [Pseudomonas veronii]
MSTFYVRWDNSNLSDYSLHAVGVFMIACALRMLASPFRDIYCAPFFKGEPCGHRYSLDLRQR